ncbi:ABC transporter permease [Clostridium sp. DJ247]|uniref:ABC transporter permease n=1 Tax=Clostridium sp. DJ247 TaxID=2726188 RepID=UPI001F4CCCF1|nr:ABC transporter permease [Clostridium sp. DJ247]
MLIIVLPVVVYLGVYFSQSDSMKGKIAIVGSDSQQKENIRKSIEGKKKVTLEFLEQEPTKTELIKGIYLAEINFTKDNPEVISYGKEDIKRELEVNIKGEIYEGNKDDTTVQGKIIGFLVMFLFSGSVMIMDFFLTDRENGVYAKVLSGNVSYYEYIAGQLLYAICIFTIPSIIMSLMVLKILSVKLSISIGLFSLLIFLLGLLSSSFSILICTLCRNKASASMGGSAITTITCLLAGCLINIVDNNKIIGFIRNCLPQKRLIDLANNYNNEDLIFLIVIVLLFVSFSVYIGKNQYEYGKFLQVCKML